MKKYPCLLIFKEILKNNRLSFFLINSEKKIKIFCFYRIFKNICCLNLLVNILINDAKPREKFYSMFHFFQCEILHYKWHPQVLSKSTTYWSICKSWWLNMKHSRSSIRELLGFSTFTKYIDMTLLKLCL